MPALGQQPTLFTANGKLYKFCIVNQSGGASVNGSAMYRSTDNGSTWTKMDGANGPTAAGGSAVLDPTNSNVVICGLVTVTFPQTAQSTFLQNFNLSTETWGAPYATGGPPAVTVVQQVFKLPNGVIRIVYDFGASNPATTSRLRAADWNGSTWGASIDVGVAIIPFLANGNVAVSNCGAALDSTGNLHLAFTSNTRSVVMYQQVLQNGTLGPSNHFTGISFVTSVAVIGNMVISGNNILISSIANAFVNNILLVGTGLTNPVWTTVSPAALASAGGFINLPGPIATDGVNLLWLVNFTDATFTYSYFQLAKSSDNGLTWAILPDNTTSPYFYNFAPATSPLAPNTDATFGTSSTALAILSPGSTTYAYGFVNVRNSSVGATIGYYMNAESLGTALTATAFEISLFGVKRVPAKGEPTREVCKEPPKVKLFC